MYRSESIYKNIVIKIVIINVVIFLIQMLTQGYQFMTFYLGLIPALVIEKGFLWQFFSYMFLHGGFFHIFLNMYALFLFGVPIEQAWGSKRFIFYYIFTGVGAGIVIFGINVIFGLSGYYIPTMGASGAVFGLLLAFGMLFPDTQILLFFIIPLRAKYLVILYGGIELYSLISTGGESNISHVGHLGGLLFGLIYFLITKKHSIIFKAKKYRVKLNKRSHTESEKSINITDKRALLLKIYKKVREAGIESLTDDEIQHINYMKIMYGDTEGLCIEDDFNIDDEFCSKCKNLEACILRELEK